MPRVAPLIPLLAAAALATGCAAGGTPVTVAQPLTAASLPPASAPPAGSTAGGSRAGAAAGSDPVASAASPAPGTSPTSPREALSAAMAASRAAGTAVYRQTVTAVGVKGLPAGVGLEPLGVAAGAVDFGRGGYSLFSYRGSTGQPAAFDFEGVVQGAAMWASDGVRRNADGELVWRRGRATSKMAATELVEVLAQATSEPELVGVENLPGQGPRKFTHYRMSVDLEGQLLAPGDRSMAALGRTLSGRSADRDVWVDPQGRIARVVEHVDTSLLPLPGLRERADGLDVTLTVGSYGVGYYRPFNPDAKS